MRDVGKEEVGGAKHVNASEGQKAGRRDKSDDDRCYDIEMESRSGTLPDPNGRKVFR